MSIVRVNPEITHHHTSPASRRAVSGIALGMAVALIVGIVSGTGSRVTAAGLNPLPTVAHALAAMHSYQVTITTAVNGARPRRPTGQRPPTPGPGTRRGTGRGPGFGLGFGGGTETLTVVAKGGTFEDYFVFTGKDAAGKTTTREYILYGGEMCQKLAGAKAFTCQTTTNSFLNDPTTAFAAGAGSSTTFTAKGSKTVNGQVCAGYGYSFTTKGSATGGPAQNSSTVGTVYVSEKTNLPCQQIATTTSHFAPGNGTAAITFSRTQMITWSRFNDPSLTVPAIPA